MGSSLENRYSEGRCQCLSVWVIRLLAAVCFCSAGSPSSRARWCFWLKPRQFLSQTQKDQNHVRAIHDKQRWRGQTLSGFVPVWALVLNVPDNFARFSQWDLAVSCRLMKAVSFEGYVAACSPFAPSSHGTSQTMSERRIQLFWVPSQKLIRWSAINESRAL